MTKKRTITTEQAALREFKNQVVCKFGSEVLLIQLFGSYARGDFHQDSDIDILVVVKSVSEDHKDFIDELVMKLAGKYEIYISAILWPQKEFEYYQSIPTLFITNILREGIKLT